MTESVPKALIPPDDAARLRALRTYKILYTEAEAVFDNLTQIMAQVFETPMVFMSLVDDETVFYKSQVGSFGRDRSSRRDSLCSIAILKDEPTIFEDTWNQPFAATNPLVQGEGCIRFYAGAPLTTNEGHRIGSICVVDTIPRALSEGQQLLLVRFSKLVMHEMDSRLAGSELIETREAQKKMLKLVENSVELMAVLELDGQYSYMNRAGQQLLGISSPTEVTKIRISDLHRPEDHDFVQHHIRPTVLKTGRWSGEIHVRHVKTDEVFPVHIQVVRIDDPETAQPMAMGTVMRDLRPERAASHALIESEQRFRTMIERAPVAIGVYATTDLKIEMANEAMIDLWGKDPSVVGTKLADALPELEGQPFIGLLNQVFETGIAYHTNEQQANLVVNGQLQSFWFNFTYQPLTNAEGKVYAILNMAVDISQQVLNRRQIEANNLLMARREAELSSLVENTPDVITRWNNQQRLVFANTAFARKTGLSNQVMLEKTYGEMGLPETITEPYMNTLQLALETCRPQEHFNVFNSETGDIFYYSRLIPEFGPDGSVSTVLGIARDITELKRFEADLESRVALRTQELVNANHDLKRSNDNLQQFAYVASHDLQEPLRKIQSFSSLIQEQYADVLGETGNDLLRRMESAGSRMSMLVKDLLNYSRISTRQQALDSISLNMVINEVLSTLEYQIRGNKGVIIIGPLPAIKGDPSQLAQLFQNLLSNALKFTPVSEVPQIEITSITLERSELPDTILPISPAKTFCRISVADKGIGFDTKYLDRIFQVFQRLHNKAEFPGTGIGLAICKRVVENHGGDITASSSPGQGTTFFVYLPL